MQDFPLDLLDMGDLPPPPHMKGTSTEVQSDNRGTHEGGHDVMGET